MSQSSAILSSPTPYTRRVAGKWKMTNTEDVQSYLQSIGVSWILAHAAATISADIDIILTDTGLKLVTTTVGMGGRSSEQTITYGRKERFINPLTGEQMLSVMQSDEWLKVIYEHKDWLIIII